MTNRILFKIYTIWFLRRIVPIMAVQTIALVAILKVLADKIFFGRVLENAALAANSSYWEFFKYLAGSFFQTHFLVQLAILFGMGVAALFWRDLARAVTIFLRNRF